MRGAERKKRGTEIVHGAGGLGLTLVGDHLLT